jgi:L-lactate dehydrogenase complex protein LldF
MNIPLPMLMRRWRERDFSAKPPTSIAKLALRAWGFLAQRPKLYRLAMGSATRVLSAMGGRRRRFSSLPLAGAWTRHRDLPAPSLRTFQRLWRERERVLRG